MFSFLGSRSMAQQQNRSIAAIMAGRSILYAYQKQGGDGTDFAEQARLAAEKMRTQILGYVTVL